MLSLTDCKIFAAESEVSGTDPDTTMLTITKITNRIPLNAPYRSHFIESSTVAPLRSSDFRSYTYLMAT